MLTTKTITYTAAALAIATSSQVAAAKEFKDKEYELWNGKTVTKNDSAGNTVLTVTDGEIELFDARIKSAKPTNPTV